MGSYQAIPTRFSSRCASYIWFPLVKSLSGPPYKSIFVSNLIITMCLKIVSFLCVSNVLCYGSSCPHVLCFVRNASPNKYVRKRNRMIDWPYKSCALGPLSRRGLFVPLNVHPIWFSSPAKVPPSEPAQNHHWLTSQNTSNYCLDLILKKHGC